MNRTAPCLLALVVSSIVLLLAIGATPAGASPELPERPPKASSVIEGHHIVVYEDSVRNVAANTSRRERRLGFRTSLRYRHALSGFSAKLSPGQVARLRADPDVDFVSRDRRVEASAAVPLVPGDKAPTGVRRILAATNTTAREHSEAGVAVIDTGIQLSHPDLNAKNGTNCISPGSPANDGDGHGTHVAGSIAARNNGAGVVGVAPDTEVHAVKVLDDGGGGSTSSVICGINWVTANHSSRDIRVANMSLGGLGDPVEPCASTTDPMHKAICNSTAAGVNYVVAAGNDGWDFDFEPVPDLPAAYPEVLTVTAMGDSDGMPGGSGGAPSCRLGESDDARASFSNFASTPAGEAHTIAAPGVCIESTWPGSSYSTISGTSMASPHMAGVVALCLDEAGADGPCASKTPAQVITHMRDDAATYNNANPGYGFVGDPNSPFFSRHYGFLTRALPPASTAPAPPTNTSSPAISGTARDGETLSASTGTWTGTPPITYSHQWRRCDSSGGACANIAGATGSNYKLTAADVGGRLRVVVTASNAGGTAGATSQSSALVDPAPSDVVPTPSPPPTDTTPPAPTPPSGEQPPISNEFSFGEVNLNRKRGIARLIVRVPGPGSVALRATKKVRPVARQAEAAGRVGLKVRPRGKAQRRISKRRCQRSGKRQLRGRVMASVIYRPAGGTPNTQQRPVRLVKRC